MEIKTFIIAEAGANHNRNFNQALALIDVAVESGASACKFQTYSSNTLYSKNTPDFAGFKNINQLIKDISRDPFKGIGKPEPLRYKYKGFWSRRIDNEHRLIYKIEGNQLLIAKCRFHYD